MKNLSAGNSSNAWQNDTELFSQAPAPIAILTGRELRYSFANDAYLKIFNYRDILNKTVREAFPELEGQGYFDILENVFDTGKPFFGSETPAVIDVNNDGNYITCYYNLVYTPYKNNENVIEGVMAFGHEVTEQVLARQKEIESDKRFRNIVQQSTDPILILKGADLVLDVANKALFELWNVDEKALGKPFLEILPEMKDQGFHELLLDVYFNGKTHYGHEAPVYFKRTSGEELHYFNFIYQPYREGDDNISGVLILASDVTEQIIARQKFTQSEINFRNMILQAPVAMCVLKGKDYVLEIANERMYTIGGRSAAYVLGKPIFEGWPEAKGQGFEALLDHVFTTGQTFTASERPVLLPRNGKLETTYLNFVYEPYREGPGNITGIIVVATEVTEQVVARQKIEFAEESARLAIESADMGSYEVNLITNELSVSPRFKEIWGIVEETTDRSALAKFIHPDDFYKREQAHKTALETGNLQYEARIVRDDKATRWVKVKGTVLFNNEGAPYRLLGVIQDITDQKLFAEELSNKVEARTRELLETNARLEQSNEELEQFAYIASHDLQEPLRKIQLFNNMLISLPGINAEAKKYIDKVTHAASRMTGLIKDLLEYSRLSQRTQHFKQTNLNTIIDNVLTDYELLIEQKNASITVAQLPVVDAVPLQMNQLFYNLVGNALKFARRNTIPEISITADEISSERMKELPSLQATGMTYISIIVKDNGIGFSPEYADKIFTIFQRLNETSLYGGYGIGLALCRKIVSRHGGTIIARGQPKAGASFEIILPYKH